MVFGDSGTKIDPKWTSFIIITQYPWWWTPENASLMEYFSCLFHHSFHSHMHLRPRNGFILSLLMRIMPWSLFEGNRMPSNVDIMNWNHFVASETANKLDPFGSWCHLFLRIISIWEEENVHSSMMKKIKAFKKP